MKRLGIFGGTFSPPHIGHVSAARAFFDEIGLDSLLIIPTYIPPHKQAYKIDPIHRLNMTKLAFSQSEGFDISVSVSDFELAKKGVSYTYLTLEHFYSPDTRLYFLCGTDMFLTLEEWKAPERIFELSDIVLSLRENTDAHMLSEIEEKKAYFEKKFSARINVLKNTPVVVASSDLRRKISEGSDVSSLVPETVYNYIKKNGLYRNK